MKSARIGLIGLAVMGANLARNIARNQFATVVYNRTTEKTDQFIAEHGNEYLFGSNTLEEFVQSIEKPRTIIIMVKAGPAVDTVIDQLVPLLDAGDLIIDCGNTHYPDTERRFTQLTEKGFRFMGCGVSGGEEGALNGPSLMPGGEKSDYDGLKDVFEKIAARDFSGGDCVTFIGERGAGHYVKMVHNGIEYAVMEIMAEAYDLLRSLYGLSAGDIADIFKQFNAGKLNSYLFEIAGDVLSQRDDLGDGFLVDSILDAAAQKGTGRWTAVDGLDRGVQVSIIAEAVFGRVLSSEKKLRTQLSSQYSAETLQPPMDLKNFVYTLENALYAAMLNCYAQGYALIQCAAAEEGWTINLAEISRIWEGGCIIRAKILQELHQAYQNAHNQQAHLFELDAINTILTELNPALRSLVSIAALSGIPIPGFSTALAYFEGMIREHHPANFIQGLRDYFGAHTYERVDQPGTFHTHWNS